VVQDRSTAPLEKRLLEMQGFENARASLAAAEFLRYANHSKLTRFGALDDLRRH
jgi:hypothetical protein